MQKKQYMARNPRNPLARIHGMIATALEDTAPDTVGWMPAHMEYEHIGIALKSDGTLITLADWRANALADELAKRAVELHRVPASEVKIWKKEANKVEQRAVWLAQATALANNFTAFPYRDSEAARWRAMAAARRRLDKRNGSMGENGAT